MRRFLIVLMAACQTPYQPMGITGGYQEKLLGNGDYIVTVKVNGYTDRSTALEYLHRRAGELCPAGYEMRDRAEGDNGSVWHDTHKAEEDAVVHCKDEKPARNSRRSPSAPALIATGEKSLYCTGPAADARQGLCFGDTNDCEAEKAQIGADARNCAETTSAGCFWTTTRLDDKRSTICAPSLKECERRRADNAIDPDFKDTSASCVIYRVKKQDAGSGEGTRTDE